MDPEFVDFLVQCHYLTQLCGLAKQDNRFNSLGLSLSSCQAAYRAVGSFTSKTVELMQVIEGSLKYLKTFFRWLYVTILRLSDEAVAPELASSTQQDVRFIANFLAKDFETDGQVRLDRVGQYLRDEPLCFVADAKNRPWNLLMESLPGLNAAFLEEVDLFQPRADLSLVQEFSQMETRVAAAFEAIPSSIGRSAVLPFNIAVGVDCEADQLKKVRISSRLLNDPKDPCSLLAVVDSAVSSKGFYLFEFTTKAAKTKPRAAFFYLGKSDHAPPKWTDYRISDIQFYNAEILSLLLQEQGESATASVFLQLSVGLIREELLPITSKGDLTSSDRVFIPSVLSQNNVRSVDVGAYIETGSFRYFHDFQASSFGLSSSRKVAAIFSQVKRKIRIFDMEVDEEEELEDEDVTEQPSYTSQGTRQSSSRSLPVSNIVLVPFSFIKSSYERTRRTKHYPTTTTTIFLWPFHLDSFDHTGSMEHVLNIIGYEVKHEKAIIN